MRASTFALALFSSLGSASAVGLLGFCLGATHADGTCKSQNDFELDFAALKPYTNTVRIYSLSDCNTLQNILPALKTSEFKILLGIWPTDDSHFAAEIAAMKKYLPMYGVNNIIGITIGSEVLYRKDLTVDALAARINTVKSSLAALGFGGVKIGTADSWNILITDAVRPVIEVSDLLLVNAFSYWQGEAPADMAHSFVDVSDIAQSKTFIESVKGNSTGFDFYVGETGWPSEGAAFQSATCNLSIAASYWQTAICGIRKWGINVFVFEAFDEPGKPSATSDTGVQVEGVEGHWGVFTVDRKAKYNLTC
ncbi:Glucan 1,3-beta-glucosidase [Neolecta irregularis DAH-3]|uniref:glucan 1,3-beta-glucosidase n=1 Tax=Neolecta irregularis (strain DAH-3) TaxID=1198029 RepID=A0A1U7LIS1_NEOID|nr:Glucan 1,3-beta-glucosidase [Neolecta irregularis DAH-3]|eukprot:OLL22544.1 Glucan 1,3-beta-glucosidase [Neolecta irregularis DAH-3]